MRGGSTSGGTLPQGVDHADQAGSRLRLGSGEFLAVVGALALFGSLFISWYRFPSRSGESPQLSENAWQIFSATDVLLAVLAALVLLAGSVAALRGEIPAVRYATCLAMGVAGLVALGIVVARVAFPPSSPELFGVVGVTLEATRLAGVFVALAAAVAMAVGGVAAATGAVLSAASWALERIGREI